MIEKHGVQCDRCSNFERLDDMTFVEKVDAAKWLHWRIFKVGNVWIHHCPVCSERRAPTKPQQQRNRWYENI